MIPKQDYRIDMPTFFDLSDKASDMYLESGTPYVQVREEYEVAELNRPIGVKGWYVSIKIAVSIELICRNAIKVI